MKRSARLSTLFLAIAVISACAQEEERPAWRIDEPRILGLRAEPPVVTPGEWARLDALVVDELGRRVEGEPSWRACNPWEFVIDPDVDCDLQASLPLDGTVSAEDILRAFPPPAGTNGPDLGAFVAVSPTNGSCERPFLPVVVVAEILVDDTRLVGMKRVPLVVSAEDGVEKNPRLESVEVCAITPPDNHQVQIRVAEESLGYVCEDDTLAPEELRLHFYTAGGDLEEGSIEISGDEVASIAWRSVQPDAILWTVVSDENWGVAWMSSTLAEVL